jgi:hypothetical protein
MVTMDKGHMDEGNAQANLGVIISGKSEDDLIERIEHAIGSMKNWHPGKPPLRRVLFTIRWKTYRRARQLLWDALKDGWAILRCPDTDLETYILIPSLKLISDQALSRLWLSSDAYLGSLGRASGRFD